MTHPDDLPQPSALSEAAAAWFLRLRDADDAATLADFDRWLSADPANARAFGKVEKAWASVGDGATAPEMVVARRDALEWTRRAARARWNAQTWTVPRRIAAALAVVLVGAGAWWGSGLDDARVYETELGERRIVTLADNTRVSLDAETRLAVDYAGNARSVELLRGQAHFDVAKDPTRPFTVTAAGQRIVALGTVFNVELVRDNVLVTLIEGRVAVSDQVAAAPAAVPPRELKAGEQLRKRKGAAPELHKPINLNDATAWRDGKLVFVDEPLAQAVERMNRYSRVSIVIADPALSVAGINGVFNAGDVDAFVEALERYFPLRVVRIRGDVIQLYGDG